jgi:hypothetical protein
MHVSHIENKIFYKLATCKSLAVFGGTIGGQHRQDSLYMALSCSPLKWILHMPRHGSCPIERAIYSRQVMCHTLERRSARAEILEFYPTLPENHLVPPSLSPTFTFIYVTRTRPKPDLLPFQPERRPICLQCAMTIVSVTTRSVYNVPWLSYQLHPDLFTMCHDYRVSNTPICLHWALTNLSVTTRSVYNGPWVS